VSSQPQPSQHHPTTEAVVHHLTKTISFLKTSLAANATYTLIGPHLFQQK
jgi:hypothetical protein